MHLLRVTMSDSDVTHRPRSPPSLTVKEGKPSASSSSIVVVEVKARWGDNHPSDVGWGAIVSSISCRSCAVVTSCLRHPPPFSTRSPPYASHRVQIHDATTQGSLPATSPSLTTPIPFLLKFCSTCLSRLPSRLLFLLELCSCSTCPPHLVHACLMDRHSRLELLS